MRTEPRSEGITELSTGTPVGSIRALCPELLGVARGKDVAIAAFDHLLEPRSSLLHRRMATDLRHTPVVGGDEGNRDLIPRADMTTTATLPREPGLASCLADLEPAEGGPP